MQKAFLLMLTTLALEAPLAAQNGAPAGGPTTAGRHNKKGVKKKNDVEAIGARNVGAGINFYSLEKEIALGKELAQEIERQARIIDDPVISEYINRIGQNLVRNSDARVPFTIRVIDTEEPNALSLPGGFLFVNSGLILLAESESEIAGAMAHEIAHIAARHGTRQATRGEIVNLSSIPLIFVGGIAGYAVTQAAGLIVPMGFLKFSRGFEREADYLGLQYMYMAGYDPNSFVDFFEKMQKSEKKKPGTLAKAFSSHPMARDRVTAAQKEIRDVLPAREEYVVDTSEFAHVKARLEAMQQRRRLENRGNRPLLRRSAGGGPAPAGNNNKEGSSAPGDEDDGRPTLKRR
jgi:predicted Zn-dependent protease